MGRQALSISDKVVWNHSQALFESLKHSQLGFLVQSDDSGACILCALLGWEKAEEETGKYSLSYCAFQLVFQMVFLKKEWGDAQENNKGFSESLSSFSVVLMLKALMGNTLPWCLFFQGGSWECFFFCFMASCVWTLLAEWSGWAENIKPKTSYLTFIRKGLGNPGFKLFFSVVGHKQYAEVVDSLKATFL